MACRSPGRVGGLLRNVVKSRGTPQSPPRMGSASLGWAADGKSLPRQSEGNLRRLQSARRLGRLTPALQLFRIRTTVSSNTNLLKAWRRRRCQAHSVRRPGRDRRNWRRRFDVAPTRRTARIEISTARAVRPLVWKWRASEGETDITVEIRDVFSAQGPHSVRIAEPVVSRPGRRFQMRRIATTRTTMRISAWGAQSRASVACASENSAKSTKPDRHASNAVGARNPIALGGVSRSVGGQGERIMSRSRENRRPLSVSKPLKGIESDARARRSSLPYATACVARPHA